ncbi:DNA replication regulator SLD2 [Bienertia sinuspersici]
MHTMGPKSYAILRHKLQQEDPNKQEPSKAKLYKNSRIRNPNKTYKTSYGKTKANMEKMEALESKENEEGASNKDPYDEVINKAEHGGRVRLYGKGVTMNKLKKVGNKSNFVFPQEFLQSI